MSSMCICEIYKESLHYSIASPSKIHSEMTVYMLNGNMNAETIPLLLLKYLSSKKYKIKGVNYEIN